MVSERVSEGIVNGMKYGITILASGALALGVYAQLWECQQPTRAITNVIVRDCPSYYTKGELHWSFHGKRLYLDGEKAIDFSSSEWDDSIKIGDSVDVVVRKSFPLSGDTLDGMSITRHKR
jgi:hypothetical protein